MKKIIHLAILWLLCPFISFAQSQEFQVHDNGLIYDEQTMDKLSLIIDSLNLRFKSCDLSHPYFALHQGKAHLVNIPNREARKMIRDGISYSNYKTTYSKNIVSENNWIIKHEYTNYKDEKIV